PTPVNVYAVIERHRPTLFYSVPTGYAMMLAHGRPEGDGSADFDLSSLRLAVSAGESLPAALYERFKQRFGVDIVDGIGSTEALHMFISNRPGAIRPGSSGQIVAGYDARILDEAHEAVPECGVIGREDHDGLTKTMAFVVLREGTRGSPELAKELQQFVRTHLAAYKRPQWVEFLPELPKTATGKIQRYRLREMAAA